MTTCAKCGTKLETGCGGALYCSSCDDREVRERAAIKRVPSAMDQQRESELTGRLDGRRGGGRWRR